MIKNTFLFLDKISHIKEKNLWKNGISDWHSFIHVKKAPGISKKRKIIHDLVLKEASKNFYDGNASWFASRLPLSEQWRCYYHFKENVLFLDIEVSHVDSGYITCMTLADENNTMTFIRGINLDMDHIKKIISRYDVIITFNGNIFDIPFLNKKNKNFIKDKLCWDLRTSCNRLGLKGSLKDIEKRLNIKRQNKIIERLHNGDPYLLWKIFNATKDRYYLDLLVGYNQEDTLNLQFMADKLYPRLVSCSSLSDTSKSHKVL